MDNKSKVRMNGKKYFLFSLVILAIFLTSSFASAAPPTGTPVSTQVSGSTIEIAYPKYKYVPQGQGFDLHVHVINQSSHLTNVTTSCWLHLYDTNGEHTMKNNMSYDGSSSLKEFEIEVDGNNFTNLGIHAYIIECFTKNEVGFASGEFTVTPSGLGDNPEFFYIILLIFYGVAFIGFFGKNEWVAMLGGMGMIGLGVYIINNGIIIFRDAVTDYIAWLTIGLGVFFALYSGLSLIKENM